MVKEARDCPGKSSPVSLSQRGSGVWNALSLEAPPQDNIQSPGNVPTLLETLCVPSMEGTVGILETLYQKVDLEEVLVIFSTGRKVALIFLPALLELGCGVSLCHRCGASVHPPGMEPLESCLFPFCFPYQLLWTLPWCCPLSRLSSSLSVGAVLLPTPQLAAHLPWEALSWLPWVL